MLSYWLTKNDFLPTFTSSGQEVENRFCLAFIPKLDLKIL